MWSSSRRTSTPGGSVCLTGSTGLKSSSENTSSERAVRAVSWPDKRSGGPLRVVRHTNVTAMRWVVRDLSLFTVRGSESTRTSDTTVRFSGVKYVSTTRLTSWGRTSARRRSNRKPARQSPYVASDPASRKARPSWEVRDSDLARFELVADALDLRHGREVRVAGNPAPRRPPIRSGRRCAERESWRRW